MYRQISSEEAVGKVVKDVVPDFLSGQVLIIFESQNFICFSAELDVMGNEAEMVEKHIDMRSFSRKKLIDHGVLTKDESDQLDRRTELHWHSEKKRSERRE